MTFDWKQRHIDRAYETPQMQRDTTDQIMVEQADEIAKLKKALAVATKALEQIAVEPKEPNTPTDFKLGYHSARMSDVAIAKIALTTLETL